MFIFTILLILSLKFIYYGLLHYVLYNNTYVLLYSLSIGIILIITCFFLYRLHRVSATRINGDVLSVIFFDEFFSLYLPLILIISLITFLIIYVIIEHGRDIVSIATMTSTFIVVILLLKIIKKWILKKMAKF